MSNTPTEYNQPARDSWRCKQNWKIKNVTLSQKQDWESKLICSGQGRWLSHWVLVVWACGPKFKLAAPVRSQTWQHTCNLRSGRGDRSISGAYWPASLIYWWSPGSVSDLVLNNKMDSDRGRYPILTSCHTQTQTHKCIHTQTRIQMHTHMNTYTNVYTHEHIHKCIHIQTHVQMHTHMNTYVNVCLHMNAH